MEYNYLPEGTLVEITFVNSHFTDDGLLTAYVPTADNTICKLFRSIDLESFHSFRDFTGESSLVKHGSKATVLKKVGRPYKIKTNSERNMYDIYDILLDTSEIRQVFRYNLLKI